MVDWLSSELRNKRGIFYLFFILILFRILFHGVFQYLEYTGALSEIMHKIYIIYLFIYSFKS